MRLWNLETGELVRAFPHDSKLHRAAAMPGGQRAVSTSEDGTIRFWDLSSGAELDRIDLATSHDVPWGVAASADGRSIFVSTFRGVLLRFDAR